MARKSQRTRRRYERRLILFIDFLGFKEHVDRTTTDPEYLTRLIDAMNLVGKIGKGLEELHRSQAITQFSDCIVASYRITEASAVFDLLSEVALCVIELAWKGFWSEVALRLAIFTTRKVILSDQPWSRPIGLSLKSPKYLAL